MNPSNVVFLKLTFEEILDDLSSRFIINVPEAELSSVERICFQVEQAHWFYEDFIRELRPELPSFQLKTFSARIFKHCPLLHQWAHEHERAYADFMQYRFRIPVCGAIILNTTLDKCLLVKGWSSKSGWGYPRGKINQDEEYHCCAIREVLEETGFDIGPLLKKPDYIELTMREQRIRLYIIQGVPEDTEFLPRTRKEISQISWIKLEDLPTYNQTDSKASTGNLNYVKSGSYRFYMVVPFINKLRQFVQQRKKSLKKDKKNKEFNSGLSKGSLSKVMINIPASPSKPNPTKKPVEPTNALKSLLGVKEERQPEGDKLLQQLFSTYSEPVTEQPQPDLTHRASYVEELLRKQMQEQNELKEAQVIEEQQRKFQEEQQRKFQEHQLQEQLRFQHMYPHPLYQPQGMNDDNMRKNSLLNALQGNPTLNTTPPVPMMNSLDPYYYVPSQFH